MNHGNRSKRARDNAPTPEQIGNARIRAGLQREEAAALIWCTAEQWNQWERGERRMHPAFWCAFIARCEGRDSTRRASARPTGILSYEKDSKMGVVKVADLIGDSLDRMVAHAMGYRMTGTIEDYGYVRWTRPDGTELCYPFRPSQDASEGLPLITAAGLAVVPFGARYGAFEADGNAYDADCGYIDVSVHDAIAEGPDFLTAGMRAIVRRAFGETLDAAAPVRLETDK